MEENIQLINFIELSEEEKEMVLKWRNDSEIRKWMYNQEEIKLFEHLDFIENLKSRKDKLYFAVKKDNEFIGVIDFTQIIENESLHMGIYTNPETKGNGKVLLNKIINYSFNILNVKKIYSEVYEANKKAYELYKIYNFNNIGKRLENKQVVICMELNYENR